MDYKVRIEQTYGTVRDNSIDFQKINKNDKGKWEPGEKKWNEKKKENVFQVDAYPFVLANMGGKDDENELKHLVYYKNGTKEVINIVIHCLHADLLNLIEINFSDFLCCHNFGNRQSKGFGSFYLTEDSLGYKPPVSDYWFSIDVSKQRTMAEKIKSLFSDLNLFWKALRGGINDSTEDSPKQFYFKSLIFRYAYWASIMWEKRSIKGHLFHLELASKSAFHNNPNILSLNWPADRNKERLVRDMLGLSLDETWHALYKDRIVKEHLFSATITPDSRNVTEPIEKFNDNTNEDKIVRFKSPITFKPIYNYRNDSFDIYVFYENIPTDIMGQSFWISKKNGVGFPIKFPEQREASIHEFLQYLFKKNSNGRYWVDIENHVEERFRNNTKFNKIKNIITQIRQNYPANNA